MGPNISTNDITNSFRDNPPTNKDLEKRKTCKNTQERKKYPDIFFPKEATMSVNKVTNAKNRKDWLQKSWLYLGT